MAKFKSRYKGKEIDGRLAGVAANFDPTRTYYVGDFAFYDNKVWRKVRNPGSGGFIIADWEPAVLGDWMVHRAVSDVQFTDTGQDGNVVISIVKEVGT